MKRASELPALSESQLEVMHAIWDKGEVTLADVWSELNARRPLAKNTVQTLLTRMVEKGWLTYRSEGNTFIYRATRERNAAHRQILDRVIDVAFRGSTEGLLLSLLEDQKLTPEQARRLRALIDAAEEK